MDFLNVRITRAMGSSRRVSRNKKYQTERVEHPSPPNVMLSSCIDYIFDRLRSLAEYAPGQTAVLPSSRSSGPRETIV